MEFVKVSELVKTCKKLASIMHVVTFAALPLSLSLSLSLSLVVSLKRIFLLFDRIYLVFLSIHIYIQQKYLSLSRK